MPGEFPAMAAVTAGGQLLDSALGQYNAVTNRHWQQDMAGTQYQRAVDDMRKAGLNPALMFGSGGPSAMGSPVMPAPSNFASVGKVGIEEALSKSTMGVNSAKEAESRASALATGQAQSESSAREAQIRAQTPVLLENLKAAGELSRAQALQAIANAKQASAQAQNLESDAPWKVLKGRLSGTVNEVINQINRVTGTGQVIEAGDGNPYGGKYSAKSVQRYSELPAPPISEVPSSTLPGPNWEAYKSRRQDNR